MPHRKQLAVLTGVYHRSLHIQSLLSAETYGILGYDESLGRNIELMEKGRGAEYGCRGGDGGQGVVVVAFFDGSMLATHESVQPDATSVLILCDNTDPDALLSSLPCLYYGGVTKANFVLTGGKFERVANILVASVAPGIRHTIGQCDTCGCVVPDGK